MSDHNTSNELTTKASLLRKTPHFSGNTTAGELSEKQAIFLVLAGKKLLSKVTSGRWKETAEGRSAGPDDEDSVADLCKNLGLAYHIQSDEYGTDVTLALDQETVTSYTKAERRNDLGRLFGFPETAVAAFDTDDMLDYDEQTKMMLSAGLPENMPQFRFSKQHASDEIKVLEDWYHMLHQYHLT